MRPGEAGAFSDPYVDPATGVLLNKLGITDERRLDEAERAFTSARLAELRVTPIQGKFDFAHFKAMHKAIFQDVYEWAGETRTVQISKGGDTFAHPDYIESSASKLLQRLAGENHLRGMFTEQFADRAAYYLSELNAIHPMREGNGRTQRAFLEQLGAQAGKPLDFSRATADDMANAARLSHQSGDYRAMRAIVDGAIRAGRELAGPSR